MDDTPQAELFAPTGPVMLRALLQQSQQRIAKLEPYLTQEQCRALYGESSLLALMVDKIEGAIVRGQAFRDAQLVPIIVPIEKARGVSERWRTRRWGKRNTPFTVTR